MPGGSCPLVIYWPAALGGAPFRYRSNQANIAPAFAPLCEGRDAMPPWLALLLVLGTLLLAWRLEGR